MRNREGKSGQLGEYDQKWKHSLATVTQTKTKVIKTFLKKGGGDNNNNKTLCLCLSGLGLSGDGVRDLLYPICRATAPHGRYLIHQIQGAPGR